MQKLDITSLINLTLPIYEEVLSKYEVLFENFENHPELRTVNLINGKAEIITVHKFFIKLRFDTKSIKEMNLKS